MQILQRLSFAGAPHDGLQPVKQKLHAARPVCVVQRDSLAVPEFSDIDRELLAIRHTRSANQRRNDSGFTLERRGDLHPQNIFRVLEALAAVLDPVRSDHNQNGVGGLNLLQDLRQVIPAEFQVVHVLPRHAAAEAQRQVIVEAAGPASAIGSPVTDEYACHYVPAAAPRPSSSNTKGSPDSRVELRK